ncbi:MAG: hypothetical protein AB1465_06310 [Patescibacteria group bacterium]
MKKAIFWDYKIKKSDLKKHKVLDFWLSRKINFGDFSDIKKSDLKKHLPHLGISQSMKQMIFRFLHSKK